MTRGFGIPATADAGKARQIATGVEELGYSTIWTNDTPSADGILTVANMAEATEGIRVGVGVVPLDRRPPDEIAGAIHDLEIPLDRLVLGVGAGSSAAALMVVRKGVEELRDTLGPELKIAVAAMGPRMSLLAGEVADTVLLNWMVPERIEWARAHVSKGSRRSKRDDLPVVAAYVRAAVGEGAAGRIAAEAAKYNTYPAYTRHFTAMGAPLGSVGVSDGDGTYAQRLSDYDRVLDEVVVRALPASDSVGSTLAVAVASAPVERA